MATPTGERRKDSSRVITNHEDAFTQKETFAYSGSAKEASITLNRGTTQNVVWVDVYYPKGSVSNSVIVGRKDTAMTSDERDDSNSASVGVMIGEQYISANGTRIYCEPLESDKKLRLYVDFGSGSDTVYVAVHYVYN